MGHKSSKPRHSSKLASVEPSNPTHASHAKLNANTESPTSPARKDSGSNGGHHKKPQVMTNAKQNMVDVGQVDEVAREKLGMGTTVGMPPADEVDRQFEDFLTDLALPPQKLEQMRAMPAERKWVLIQQQRSKFEAKSMDILNASPTKGVPPPVHEPAAYIEMLKTEKSTQELAKDIKSLEVSLRTEPINWVKEFLKSGGLEALLKILKRLSIKSELTPHERDCQVQCVRALKAQMNNTYGLQTTMQYEDGINILALSLGCSIMKMKTLALEVMAAVCFVPPNGHALILNAMQYYKEVKKEKFRFQQLVTNLVNPDLELGDEAAAYLEFQIACMAFINAVVNSPEDLDHRVTLRNEFMDLGIADLLPELRKLHNDELNTQLNIFEDEGAADIEAISETLNLADHLTLLPSDQHRRAKYWQLVSLVVNQIILQRNGINPDVARLSIDVEKTISALVTQEDYDKATLNAQGWQSQIDEWKTKVAEWEKSAKLAKEYGEMLKRKDEEIKRLKGERERENGGKESAVKDLAKRLSMGNNLAVVGEVNVQVVGKLALKAANVLLFILSSRCIVVLAAEDINTLSNGVSIELSKAPLPPNESVSPKALESLQAYINDIVEKAKKLAPALPSPRSTGFPTTSTSNHSSSERISSNASGFPSSGSTIRSKIAGLSASVDSLAIGSNPLRPRNPVGGSRGKLNGSNEE
ncbi:hypothetical protein HK102_008680, partial [Quaeritorhiza haematococci]